MPVPLRLTPNEPQPLDPNTLFNHLQHAFQTFDQLLDSLHATPAQLKLTLADKATSEQLKLQTHLCALQIKLLALKYVPNAFAHLVKLMDSDKPEVARRASTTILTLAGLSTTVSKQEQPATPTPVPDPKAPVPQECPEDFQELFSNLDFALYLRREGLVADKIPTDIFPTILTAVKSALHTPAPTPR